MFNMGGFMELLMDLVYVLLYLFLFAVRRNIIKLFVVV